MKAVLLAAGKGSRLGAITGEVPKPLLEVRGKPLLQWHLERCARQGIGVVFINTHHLAEKVREFAGDGSRFGLRVEYSFEPELLGTSGALHNFRDRLGDGPFFVIYGDNLLEFDAGAMLDEHVRSGAFATIALHHREDVSMSGMVVFGEGGKIVKLIEKPPPEERCSNLVNAGVYVLGPDIFEHLPDGPSDFAREIFPALLAEGKHLQGYVLPGEVVAVDTPELLRAATER